MNARRRDEAKVGTLARSATMQAPLLAQPDKRASLQRDRAIWADGCIGCWLRGPISWSHTVPSARIARSRTRDLISASLGVHASAVFKFLAHQIPTNHTSDMTAGELLESVGQLGVAEAYSAFIQHAVEVNGLALKTPPPPGLPGNFTAGVRP